MYRLVNSCWNTRPFPTVSQMVSQLHPRTAHTPTVSSIHPLKSLLSILDIRVATCFTRVWDCWEHQQPYRRELSQAHKG